MKKNRANTKSYPTSKQACAEAKTFNGALLGWYDRHRRVLPWRVLKGQVSEPYHVWLSEIMLQQTTVGAVKPYFEKFLELWPSVHDLADAAQEDVLNAWAGLGYYARARNLHACAQVIAHDFGGIFPKEQKVLKALPGIGDYTSAAIMAIAFNQAAVVVDGNVERVMARYFALTEQLPAAKKTLKALAAGFFEAERGRPGDLAQAFMDLGATICIPKAPRCSLCPVQDGCIGYAEGMPEKYPVKAPKKKRPQRYGAVYWIEDDRGRVLLHRRQQRGLLGGMIALPTTDWVERKNNVQHIDFIDVIKPSEQGKIYHTFTHFDLTLELKLARAVSALPADYFWSDKDELERHGFPAVFKKALKQFLK